MDKTLQKSRRHPLVNLRMKVEFKGHNKHLMENECIKFKKKLLDGNC